MTPSVISKGFLFAGLTNIVGTLLFSKLFTNEVMMQAQPDVMGYFGLIAIMLWGCAYIAVRNSYAAVPWLVGVFVFEKLLYVVVYIRWIRSHSLSDVYTQDTFAGLFYTLYGASDFLFGVFFAVVLYTVLKDKNSGL